MCIDVGEHCESNWQRSTWRGFYGEECLIRSGNGESVATIINITYAYRQLVYVIERHSHNVTLFLMGRDGTFLERKYSMNKAV